MQDAIKVLVISFFTAVGVYVFLGPHLPQVKGSGTVASPTAQEDAGLVAPNLVGLEFSNAYGQYSPHGIAVIEDGKREDTKAQPGTILSQIPSPGEPMANKELRVIVAKQPDELAVPNVIGNKRHSARDKLVAAGFEVPPETFEGSNEPEGTVLRQEPNAGARVRPGATIQLVVAAQQVQVPDITRKNVRKVDKLLEEVGLHLGSRKQVQHPEHGYGYILSQEPAAGSKVPPGTKVNVRIVAPP